MDEHKEELSEHLPVEPSTDSSPEVPSQQSLELARDLLLKSQDEQPVPPSVGPTSPKRRKYVRIVTYFLITVGVLSLLGVGLYFACIKAVRSPNPRLHQPALSLALFFKDRSVPMLEEALNDEQAALPARLAIIEGLGSLYSLDAQQALLRSLAIDDSEIRLTIQDALISQGKPLIPPMLEALNEPTLHTSLAPVLVGLGETVTGPLDLQGADLSRLELSGVVLTGANLAKADLSAANLTNAELSGSNLSGADFSGAILNMAELRDSNITPVQLVSARSLRSIGLEGLDLHAVDLTDIDLSGAKLSGSDLTEAVLTNTVLTDADLSDAVLNNSNINDAQLSTASHLTGISLVGVDLSYANLWELDLTGANLSQANLSYVSLRGSILQDAILSGANLQQSSITVEQLRSASSLVGSKLSYTDLSNGDLSELNFGQVILDGADLSNSNLEGADFTGASLKAVILRGSNITVQQLASAETITSIIMPEMNFEGEDFSELNLANANLSDSNFRGVQFTNTSLVNTILSNAVLTDSTLTSSQLLDAAKLDGITLPGFDFTNANLRSVNLQRANLSDADFHSADLASGNFTSANLSNADFQGADLTSAFFTNANLTGANFSGAILDSTTLFNTIGFTPEMYESAASRDNAKLQDLQEFIDLGWQICDGDPYPQAYAGMPGFHPTVVMWERSNRPSYTKIASAEHPLWMNYYENVACITPSDRLVQTCTGYVYVSTGLPAPNIRRYQRQVTIDVYQALTGDLITSHVVEGPAPRSCQYRESTTYIYGGSVDEQDVFDWIYTYITDELP